MLPVGASDHTKLLLLYQTVAKKAYLYRSNISTQIFHSFMDGAAAKQSACMTAMENSSVNAGEMIDS